MLGLARVPNGAAKATAIYDLEQKFAQVHWTKAESRDDDKTYNNWTPAQLAQRLMAQEDDDDDDAMDDEDGENRGVPPVPPIPAVPKLNGRVAGH